MQRRRLEVVLQRRAEGNLLPPIPLQYLPQIGLGLASLLKGRDGSPAVAATAGIVRRLGGRLRAVREIARERERDRERDESEGRFGRLGGFRLGSCWVRV